MTSHIDQAVPAVAGTPDVTRRAAPRHAPPVEDAGPSATGEAHVLELHELSAGYGDLAAVKGVTMHVARGEVVALFGANGAGKTTTLLAAAGVLPRMSGSVRWLGEHTRRPLHRLARSGLAFVPEERSITTKLSVADNLRLGRGGVAGALAHFPELEPLLDRRAGLLSGGEQQMLTVGRALASRPRALLVDELSLGLAPLVVERLLAAVRTAADRDGVAVMLVEQQARRALSVLDRWYLLSNGRLTAEGAAAQGAEALEAAYLANVGNAAPADG
ncbi:ABC transporter ATP-binding protein [uncultured Jatrophihabitans sp.]|uniref:ABC transporter ATP-binding protein n=1 Tax=uncultured Jatrophihabitans sp. TaxID=1610747 RepID=UPI0035CBEA36